MANITMTAEDVKEARRRAWLGEPVKAIARDMGLTYGPVYTAVRGSTWGSIVEPPAVPKGYKVTSFRVCTNELCGDVYEGGGGALGLCRACYAYSRRNGEQRDASKVQKGQGRRIDIENLDELWAEYEDGASLADLAEGYGFTMETLRRKFREAGHELRGKVALRRVLTAPMVRHARILVNGDGVPISEVAEELGQNYNTVLSAVKGHTWRGAGGPLPEENPEQTEKRKCERCGLLTRQRLCRYCRNGN